MPNKRMILSSNHSISHESRATPIPYNLSQVLHHPAVFAENIDFRVVGPVASIAAEGPVVDPLRQLVVGLV